MFFMKTFLGIIRDPYKEFKRIESYDSNFLKMVKDFLIYIVLINITLSIIKIYLYGPYNGKTMKGSIKMAIFIGLLSILITYIIAIIINFFSDKFKCEKKIETALKISTFTSVASVLGSIINLTNYKILVIIKVLYLVFLRFVSIKVLYKCNDRPLLFALIPEVLLILPAVMIIAIGFMVQQMFFM